KNLVAERIRNLRPTRCVRCAYPIQPPPDSRSPPGHSEPVNSLRRKSAERECKSLHARIEKLDLKLSISDELQLSNQLIQPLVGNRSVALIVNVNSVSCARRLSIDQHAKSHGSSSRCRSHDEMNIAGVKAVRDPPVGLVQHGGLFPDRPIP